MHRRPSNDRLYATERFHRLFMVLFAPAYAIFLPFISRLPRPGPPETIRSGGYGSR
jgi:hypothetical protein